MPDMVGKHEFVLRADYTGAPTATKSLAFDLSSRFVVIIHSVSAKPPVDGTGKDAAANSK